MWVLHGYPFPTITIMDQVTIRGLMELELWLAMTDQRRAHSMENTGKVYINNAPPEEGQGRRRLSFYGGDSMNSKDKLAFVGLGWSKLAKSLAATMEISEKTFLKVMLEELNSEFTVQMDTEPVLYWLVHSAHLRSQH